MSPPSTSSTTTPSTVAVTAAPFPSWTFDKPCPKMEWNTLSTKTKLVAGNTTIESVDYVMIGVFHPTTITTSTTTATATDGHSSSSRHHKGTTPEEHPPPLFTGSMLKMNEGMNNALQDLYYEQDVKTRSVVGTVSPTLRTTTLTTTKSIGTNTKRYAIVSLGPSWIEADTTTRNTSVAAILGTTPSSQLPSPSPPVAIGLTIGKAIAKACKNETKIRIASIHLPDTIVNNHVVLRDIATSFYTELYQDHRFKGRKNPPATPSADSETTLSTVYIRCEDGIVSQDILDTGYTIAQGVILTKDIVNAPHNVLNSTSLAETAQRIAALSVDHRIHCAILNKEQCEALHMGAYLGVARGSETPPQFIHLSYISPPSKDNTTPRKRIGFVGKGLLFDTGGYNIKTQMMELMKFDCGGAAAVLGAAHAIGQLSMSQQELLLPKHIEIHFIVAACENMINDRAIVPSDVLTASNGVTIEIMNTDAEGRLTLADALVYADVTCQCDTIIELSTLTGACMISLGKEICGLWTYSDALAEEIIAISKTTNDQAWRMPLPSEYEEQIQSKIADLQNLGGKYGGAITAALFLQHFVNHKEKSFAHLDIAGPVWDDKTGATGFGTKLIFEYITRQGK